MPTYCTAPNCKNDAKNKSDRKSYYKFPLHDPARLQQWLKNMGREGWTPSRHQHLCHEHFTPSCFTLRWGIRYLSNDAVPTVFQLTVNAEKRKSSDHSERKPKRRRPSGGSAPVQTAQACTLVAGETVCQDADANTVQLYTITLGHSHPGQPILLGSSDVEPSGRPGQTAVPLPGAGSHFPVSFSTTVEGLGQAGGEEHAQVMLVSKNPLMEKEGEVEVEGITPAFPTEGQDIVIGDVVLQGEPAPSSLLIENMALEMVEPSVAQDDRGVQVVAYFETIPSVLPTASAQPGLPPDTVLSSALSSKPIVSTLPIVSKHIPPSSGSLVLTLERLETVETEVEGPREAHEEDSVEQQGKRLEEHRYHKNSLSKEQLEAIVVELQKKVKVLQQRHRRHLDKLLGLESTVGQLRHSNLLNEERLRLLERAYIQTSAAVSDAGETVAIICGEENTAYLYALPASEEEEGTDQD